MSTLLLLFQTFSGTPAASSGVYAMPLSGVVQAVYPMGPETGPRISGAVDESARLSGITGQI